MVSTNPLFTKTVLFSEKIKCKELVSKENHFQLVIIQEVLNKFKNLTEKSRRKLLQTYSTSNIT